MQNIKILIVDDDVIIRRGLGKNIPWEENGFSIIGSEADGEMALKAIERERPQIVISDIKMPFMDGLQLTKAIKSKYPEIQIILLSGYEEFEYAKEAVKLKAFDYLLKPVNMDILLETVKRAAWELENEDRVKKQINESIPLLKQQFFLELIHGKLRESEIAPRINFLNIELFNAKTIVLCIKPDDYYNESYYVKVMEKELLKFCICNICNEIFQDIGKSELVNLGSEEIVLICTYDSLNETDFLEGILEHAESLRQKVEIYLKTTVTIGIGRIYRGLSQVRQSYMEAVTATEFRHILGKNQVLYIEDTGEPTKSDMDFDINSAELVQKIKLGLSNEAVGFLMQLKERLLSYKYVSLDAVQLVGMEICISLFKEVEGFNEFYKNHSEKKDFLGYSNELQKIQTINEIFEFLKDLIIMGCNYVNEKRVSQQTSLILNAIKYINENYQKEGLSLKDVAREVHVSPTYLSIIFKQEKDINFSDFLLEVRMKKAMELLRSNDFKTYEVADRVGYSNAQYFSVCFKKFTGCSPSEFKNN